MKSRRKAWDFPWRAIWALALLLSAAVLLIRACVYYKGETEDSVPEILNEGRSILVYNDETGACMKMRLESYLCGVVAAEMPASFESEALKAQAVAARTYTLRRMEKPCGRSGADICTDSTCCQAYKDTEALKKNWKKDYEKNIEKVTEAVRATEGEAIYYEGELIEALYHSSSGGRTEDAQHVFAQARPYLISVASPGEESSAKFRDTLTLSRKSFAKKVNKEWKNANLKASKLMEQVKIVSRYESGRVETIRLGKAEATGRDLRKLLELNSANFSIAYTDEDVILSTLGYGHGVGMSQYGANAMALEGADYHEILSYYYSGVEIK